jgi:cytochrome c556
MRSPWKLRILLASFSVLALTGVVIAHEGATGVVKERMDLMKGQQKNMKLIGDMAKGKKRFDAEKAAAAARDLGSTTRKIPELFPKGSSGHPSEALDAVWEDWDQFVEDAKKAEGAANDLAAMLESNPPQDWKADFKTMIDACKSCHESFRAEEDEEEDKHGGH